MKRPPAVPRVGGIQGRKSPRLIDRLAAERSELVSLLVDEPGTGVLVLDREARVLRANSALARMSGRPADRLRGCAAAALFHVGDQDRVGRALARAIARRGEPAGFSARLADPAARDAVRPVHVTCTVIQEAGGAVSGLLVRVADISERQQLEAALAQARQVEAIGQVAAGLAHDFNNLLTAIGGTVELGQARAPTDAATADDLRQIAAAAARGSALIRQVLALGREPVLATAATSVNDTVRAAAELIRRLLGRPDGIELALDLAEPDRLVWADRAQLDRAIVNLAINARDAMAAGGKLTLRTGCRTLSALLSHDGETIPPGRYVTIEVADTGTGIAAADLPRVRDPFFTTRRDRGGTGLGLSVVDGIARQSGGFVELESALGRGTCVRIHLPRHEAEPAITPPPSPAADVPSAPSDGAGGRVVLVVDDDDLVRRVAQRAFERAGWRVLSADGADTAFVCLRSAAASGRPDLIVSDLIMPGTSGPELVQAVRREFGSVPAILVSGYADAAPCGQLLPDTAAFLPKPYVLRELIALADQLVAAFRLSGMA